MKINEVIVNEAGFLKTVGSLAGAAVKGVGKGLADIAAPGAVNKYKDMSNRIKSSAADKAQAPAHIPTIPPAGKIEPVKSQAAKMAVGAKTAAGTEVIKVEPLTLKYKNTSYIRGGANGEWTRFNSIKPLSSVEQAFFDSEEDELNPIESTPTQSNDADVFKSNRIVAKINSSAGLAVKNADGKWHVNNVPVTKPEDIANLDQEARATGQLK